MDSVESGWTLNLKYTYDSDNETSPGVSLHVFLAAEGGTADFTNPDGTGALAGEEFLESGTVSVTATADGWFRFCVRVATTPGSVEKLYGDSGSQLSALSLTGADASNTNAGVLYWTFADAAGTRTVSIYKDSAKGAGDLVAQGSRSGDGVITLAEQNASGLSGSVTVAYSGDDTDSGNTIYVCRLSANTALTGPVFLSDDVPGEPANTEAIVIS